MAAFRSLTSDRKPLETFKLEASKAYNPKSIDAKSKDAGTALHLHLFEWSQSSQEGTENSNIRSVSELEARDPVTVRVV